MIFSTEDREALNDVILPFDEETVLSNFLIREVVVSSVKRCHETLLPLTKHFHSVIRRPCYLTLQSSPVPDEDGLYCLIPHVASCASAPF